VTIEQLGSIGEVVGAVATVATLAYLALQIRQNTAQIEQGTRAARGSAYQAVLAQNQAATAQVPVDAELADIIRRGIEDSAALSEPDYFRFNWMLSAQFYAWDNAFYQFQDGVLPSERWESLVEQIRWFLKAPGYRARYATWPKIGISQDLVSLIDSELERIEIAAQQSVAADSARAE
jgi:hypothetical protein